MIIYVDLVFFLNVLLDFMLLMSVSIILRRNTEIKKIILGSIIGGISTFTLFVNIGGFLLFLLKIILGLIMVIICFGYHDLKYTYNNMFYLLTLSFSIGGVLYLLMDKDYYNYVIIIFGFLLVCFIYSKQMRKIKNNYANYYLVEIIYHHQKIKLTGFLDTGNKLYDFYQHRPIILIDKKIHYELEDIIYVPYVTVNNHSILKCIKPDSIVINKHSFSNYLVGLSNNKIQIEGIDCLLHSEMKGDLYA